MSRGNGSTGARPTADEVLQRQTKALQARNSGLTWEQTAQFAGYSNRQNAQKAVMKLLQANAVESVDEHRALSALRLERLLQSVWARALQGDMAAWDRAERAVMDLARLMGSIMPTKIEVTDEMDREIKALAAALSKGDAFDITDLPQLPEAVESQEEEV
jgi:hypothetical protein